MPVAVSVPEDAEIEITMTVDTWAFGEIDGAPVGAGRQAAAPRRSGTE